MNRLESLEPLAGRLADFIHSRKETLEHSPMLTPEEESELEWAENLLEDCKEHRIVLLSDLED